MPNWTLELDFEFDTSRTYCMDENLNSLKIVWGLTSHMDEILNNLNSMSPMSHGWNTKQSQHTLRDSRNPMSQMKFSPNQPL